MKKLALITLTALVCLCLAGCADDTVTPNELTAPVTPNEVIEQPVVTPNEPETPDEPETPAEPIETPTEPKDDVIILPGPDEDTVEISISIPQDFINRQYTVCTVPTLTEPEYFEWGEYLPIICTDPYSADGPSKYRILSEKCKTLDDGRALYEKLNEENEEYISEFTDKKTDEDLDKYVAFNGISSMEWPNDASLMIFDHYIVPETPEEIEATQIKYGIDNFVLFHEKRMYVYSEDKTKLTHIIIAPTYVDLTYENGSQENYSMYFNFFDDEKIIVEISKHFTTNKYDGTDKVFRSLYYLDLDDPVLRHISDYSYSPGISPDGKYLVYFSPREPDGVSAIGAFDVLPKGCYVKNLENGTTVFFEYENIRDIASCIGWISKEKVIRTINE